MYVGVVHILTHLWCLQTAGFGYHAPFFPNVQIAMYIVGQVGWNWGFFQYWHQMNNEQFNLWMYHPTIIAAIPGGFLVQWKLWDPSIDTELTKDQILKKKVQGLLRSFIYM